MAAKTLSEVLLEIEADNVRLREKFVSTEPLLTASDLATWTARGYIRPGELDAWVANREIFSVPVDGGEAFPAFQFDAYRPRPVVSKVLRELVEMSAWQVAFWFVSSNPALDGRAPVSVLDDEEAVVRATQPDGYVG